MHWVDSFSNVLLECHGLYPEQFWFIEKYFLTPLWESMMFSLVNFWMGFYVLVSCRSDALNVLDDI